MAVFSKARQNLTLAFIMASSLFIKTNEGQARTRAEIWLAPLSQEYSGYGEGSSDFSNLFTSPASWSDVLARTTTFKLYPYFVGHAPDALLIQIIAFLKAHGLKLALEARVLDAQSPCGSDGGDWTVGLLQRIKDLGGTVSYVAMDEPLYHLRALEKCTASNALVTADVNRKRAAFRAVFPDLEIGDVEPVANTPSFGLSPDDILGWVSAYRTPEGTPFAFFQADVVWTYPWLQPVERLMQSIKSQGVEFGVIYNGLDFATTDGDWAKEARSHFLQLEDQDQKTPDMAVFQTWVGHPTHVLPETSWSSLTGITFSYIQFQNMSEN